MSEATVKTGWGQWKTEFDTSNLLGEIVSWDVSVQGVPHSQVKLALENAGLDPKLAREMPAVRALKRAIRRLKRQQLVTEIEDTNEKIVFQFGTVNKAEHAEDKFYNYVHDYQRNGRVVLNKETGDLDGDDPELVRRVAEALDQEIGVRQTQDITRIGHKIFRENADLFCIRKAGGTYFVPARHSGVVDAVQKFLEGVGTGLGRYPIAKGHLTGDASVRDAVKSGIQRMLEDHAVAITKFSSATRKSTMRGELDGVKLAKFKIDAYVEYLGEEVEGLKKSAQAAENLWRETVERLIDEEAQQEESKAEEPKEVELVEV